MNDSHSPPQDRSLSAPRPSSAPAAVGSDLEQIALLAEIDDLTERLQKWIDDAPPWKPARRARRLVTRLLERIGTVRMRLECPLIVATFGGTGTGKSSLVNALVGQEVTTAGRQRPTTTVPVLLIHRDLEPESLRLNLDDFQVHALDSDLLRDVVLIDCPDPDTSDTASAGSNLAVLRSLLPHCDVLLYTSTQQKYRSARIIDELADAASGCRLVFVQTHADLDDDIRDDWKSHLAPHYDVPDLFFVDSVRALAEQRQGLRPGGEFGRLLRLLSEQLDRSRRLAVRRANVVELLLEALTACRQQYDQALPAVQELRTVLDDQRHRLQQELTRQLADELLISGHLWERRLLSAVTDRRGFSPFASILRLYNSLGSFLASFSLFRARSSAQIALIGAVQSVRWVRSHVEEQGAESRLERLASFGIPDQQLQESRVIISGYIRSAEIETDSNARSGDLASLRETAASLESEVLGDARRAVDEIIDQVADRHSGRLRHLLFETLFLSYVAFLLGRIGHNFFWSSFLGPILGGSAEAEPLLSVDFYIPALLFLVIWSGLLVYVFTAGLRRSLQRHLRELAERMAGTTLMHGLFPSLEDACEQIDEDSQRVSALLEEVKAFRRRLAAGLPSLGGRRNTPSEAPSATDRAVSG